MWFALTIQFDGMSGKSIFSSFVIFDIGQLESFLYGNFIKMVEQKKKKRKTLNGEEKNGNKTMAFRCDNVTARQ